MVLSGNEDDDDNIKLNRTILSVGHDIYIPLLFCYVAPVIQL